MAKVSILTFHYANNYGAVLQAYGLSKAIQKMGYDVEVIDYRPLAARLCYDGHWPRRPIRFLNTAVFRWNFHRFRQNYLPLSRKYLSIAELKKSPPETDCLVCGSDQIWNIASYRGFDPAFFLDFIKSPNMKRISYAACFGNTEDLGEHHAKIRRLLSCFDRISVRDIKSQKMVENIVSRSAERVLDPSFLNDYGPITPAPVIKPPYVFMYNVAKSKLSMHAAQIISKYLNIPVVTVGLKKVDGTITVNASPIQWLSLIHYASFVCTNSFHGICFSLINKKEFVTLPIENGMSRIEDLLQTAGLSCRLVHDDHELKNCLVIPIDYDAASLRLHKARRCSETFLQEALKSGKCQK